MMLIPRRNEFDIFDNMFKDPFFNHEESRIMKTDITEKKDSYLIEIDLPGYEKENIQIEINDGYLNIHAFTNTSNDSSEEGKFVKKERFFGECSRSFYVGDEVTEEQVKASFRNGTLKLEIPKIEKTNKIPEKKYIQITD